MEYLSKQERNQIFKILLRSNKEWGELLGLESVRVSQLKNTDAGLLSKHWDIVKSELFPVLLILFEEEIIQHTLNVYQEELAEWFASDMKARLKKSTERFRETLQNGLQS